jgi:hypothetical protein
METRISPSGEPGGYAVPASADGAVVAAGYADKFAYQRKTLPF